MSTPNGVNPNDEDAVGDSYEKMAQTLPEEDKEAIFSELLSREGEVRPVDGLTGKKESAAKDNGWSFVTDYEKSIYEVRTPEGEIVRCWPNAGFFNDVQTKEDRRWDVGTVEARVVSNWWE